MRSILRAWWGGPGGLREVLGLSVPLMVSTMSWTIMIFVDRVYLAWYSRDAVAAALPAGALSFAMVCFPLGVASYCTAFVSQYFGARRPEKIGLCVWQGVWLGLLVTPLAAAVVPFAAGFFAGAGHSAEVAALETEYFTALNWGNGALVLSAALSSFFTGRGQMKTVMIVDSLAAALNVVLDYAWIFGNWGFPEWGVAGAAWATVVSLWLKTLVYAALFLAPRMAREFGTRSGCRFDRRLAGRLLWYGAASGVQFQFEVGAFTVFLLLLGQLGPDALAATSLAFNVNTLAFMPVYGIGQAVTAMVGRRLGENRPDLATRSTWSAFAIGAGLMLVIGSAYVFVPDIFLAPHASQMAPEEFAATRDQTVLLLRFVAAYCLFDAMNVIFSGAIKGAGDTRFVLLLTLAFSGIPVVLTWCGQRLWGGGLYWGWAAVTLWVCALGLAFLARFVQGAWKEMRVIEKEAPAIEGEMPDLAAVPRRMSDA